MAYKTHFLDIAIQELDDAKEYYEYQQSNLGIKFTEDKLNITQSNQTSQTHHLHFHLFFYF